MENDHTIKTDTDRIEALEALIYRTNIVNGKEIKLSSDIYICGRGGKHEQFMLCLRTPAIGSNERVILASSMRELIDQLIDYERSTPASLG